MYVMRPGVRPVLAVLPCNTAAGGDGRHGSGMKNCIRVMAAGGICTSVRVWAGRVGAVQLCRILAPGGLPGAGGSAHGMARLAGMIGVVVG